MIGLIWLNDTVNIINATYYVAKFDLKLASLMKIVNYSQSLALSILINITLAVIRARGPIINDSHLLL